MTLLNWIFVAWSVVTTALVLLLIYRSTVSMKEDDQLFLDPAERQLEEEQKEIRRTLDRLSPALRVLGFGSGGLAVGMLGTVVYMVVQAL
jgi:hypothetical protein